jgi:hypothetical protein
MGGRGQRVTALVAEILALRADLVARGLTRVVLAGMGGSSLAPEVIARTAGVPLVILDSTDPAQVLAAIDGDAESGGLAQTVLVVASKSGRPSRPTPQRAFAAAWSISASIRRAHRRGHRPGIPARAVRPRGRLPRVHRRPERGGTLFGAHRLRAGALGARGRGHRRAPGRGGGDAAGGRHRRPRNPALTSPRPSPAATGATSWA